MIPNPIRKVLSSMHGRRVRALLMGGQACVFYGAAEFSRDTDIAILADSTNLARLRRALDDLGAECIAVPELSLRNLRRDPASPLSPVQMEGSLIRCGMVSVTDRNADVASTSYQRSNRVPATAPRMVTIRIARPYQVTKKIGLSCVQ